MELHGISKIELKKMMKETMISALAEVREVRKIEGYQKYYRIKLGDYSLGIKVTKNRIELIRFLHRKDTYRRFP